MTDVPAAAITAATWALHGRGKNDPSGAMDGVCACHSAEEHDLFLAEDEAAAKLMLEAAAPHLTAADPTTESEGFRAYQAGLAAGRAEGAAAERQRIQKLAESWIADTCNDWGGEVTRSLGRQLSAKLREDAP